MADHHPPLILTVLCWFPAILLGYGFGLVVYRLTFHPLSKFPGPKLAAATQWYEFYFDCIRSPGGQFMWEINRMHEKYGPIVRISPDELHVADPDWYEVVNSAGGAIRHKYAPSANLIGTPKAIFGTVDHHLHRARKAPLASFLSRASVKHFEPIMREHVEGFCNHLRKAQAQGEVMNLRLKLLAFTSDLVGVYGFGGPLGLQDSPERAAEWLNTMNAVAVVTPFFRQYPAVLPFLFKVPQWIVNAIYPPVVPLLKLQNEMREKAAEALRRDSAKVSDDIETKAQQDSRPENMFDAILSSNLPPHEKSLDRLWQDGFISITAGGDPPARTMTIGLYHLLANPHYLKRLQAELDKAIPDPDYLPGLKELEALPFLTAVIKETSRITALITSRLPLVSDTPLQYRDWSIPAGTPVGTTIHQVLTDKKYFPDPEVFRPERWLEVREDGVKLERYYVPYGRGSRICLGQNFANAEIHMTLSAILRRFEMRLVDTVYERDVKTVRDCFLGESSPECTGVKAVIIGERI